MTHHHSRHLAKLKSMEQISKQNRFFVRERIFYKRFFLLTAGLALQNLLAYSVNLMDNLMLGAYSEEALSGAALVNQIQFFLQMLIGAVGNGVVIFGAQYWGKRETEPIKRFMSLGLFIGAVIGFCFLIVMSLVPEPILRLLTPEEPVIEQALSYLSVVRFTYPVFAVTMVLVATMRSVEVVRIGYMISTPEEPVIEQALSYLSVVRFTYPVFAVTMVLVATMRSVEVVRIGYMISASTLCINTILNYFLIFGNFGFPEFGAEGAAIATLCSRLVELGIVLFFIRFRERILNIRWKDCFSVTAACVKDYVRVASPIIISDGLWGMAMLIQSAVLGHMGQEAIAANSIAAIVFQIMSVVTYGSASAAGIMTGKAVGSGDKERVIRYTKTFQILFLGIGLFTSSMILLSKGQILNFYQVSDETKQLANQFLTVLSVTAIGTSYQMACLTGIVRSGGDTRFVLINDLIFMWGIVLPSSAAAAFLLHLPPVIVFICLTGIVRSGGDTRFVLINDLIFMWGIVLPSSAAAAFLLHLPPVIVFICLKCDQILKCFVAVVKVNRFNWMKRLTRE